MFYYLNGTVSHIAPYLAVIDCGGVGYACKTTTHTIAALTRGKSTKLYTHLYVREEVFELYGFISEEELSCFQMLIGVSGVGPKAALAILSSNTPEALALAIVSGNEKALTSAPGIGKKIAQRIILELKDKLAKGQLTVSGGEAFAGGVTIIRNTANGRYLLEAQTNVEGSRSRFAFMQATNSPPSMRMQKDWKRYGPSAFTFQVLEELVQKEGQTAEEFRADLAVLGELWAEKFDPALSY